MDWSTIIIALAISFVLFMIVGKAAGRANEKREKTEREERECEEAQNAHKKAVETLKKTKELLGL
ncbi:MAG: hypothetical protein LBU95_02130 [Rikenellaceae bacterium]|jgi:large-conductance mechanosensitive channel|nr:hypothetical protein [Rikenellaceae bacterium]